jgi:glycosyltransferase involved in cell wall biosynthesis
MGAASAMGRVCIVTPSYLASTPRVVREADALSAAGFDVRVTFTQGPFERLRAHDAELLASRRWRASIHRWSTARSGERWTFLRSGVRHRLAQRLAARLDMPGLAERAEGRIYPELAALAMAEPADLFIGHYPTGLAAAAAAARCHTAQLGYDIEDLYADTYPLTDEWRPVRDRIIQLERRYVPACRHLTAVSAPVADAFAGRYATSLPVLVHNAHPWADRQRLDGRVVDRQGPALSLFWFSQVVGLDRGLQDAIRAAGLVPAPVQIHLRGSVDDQVRRELTELAASCGLADRLYFHPRSAPDELLSRAAEHDVGLALETADALNRRLTVTNKLFLYLTAGLALATTDVPGQRGILESCPRAGALHAPGDVAALAAHLTAWARHPDRLAEAKQASLDAAKTQWNAEGEGARLVAGVRDMLRRGTTRARASGE